MGWSLILLALVALVAAARRRLEPRLSDAVLAAAAMGTVALLWSAPPKVAAFGHLIPFPSLLTFEISPTWRVYSRLVMVVMLAVVVLGSIGLHRLLKGRPYAVRALLFVAIAAVVVIDLRAVPLAPTKLGERPSLERLSQLPEGIVANYPIEPAGFGDYSAEFNQGLHGKPIINGYEEGSLAEKRALEFDELDDPTDTGEARRTGGALGVVRPCADRGRRTGPGPPRARPADRHGRWPSCGLRGHGEAAAARYHRPGLRRRSRWLPAASGIAGSSDEGQVELLGPCSACKGTLKVDAESFQRPRTVSLARKDGSLVSARRVPAGKRVRVSFPVEFRHRETLLVRTEPGPLPATPPDPRSFSVSFTDPRLEFDD